MLQGRKKKVFVCSSSVGNQENAVPCHYKMTWRKHSKNGLCWWDLDRSDSFRIHAIGCEAKQQMTAEMIANNPIFAGVIVDDKSASLKTLIRNSLTKGFTKTSVSRRTLYRAKERVLKNNAKNYDENFNHMHTWLEEFAKKNPGSHWNIERDHENRHVCGSTKHVDLTFWHFVILAI